MPAYRLVDVPGGGTTLEPSPMDAGPWESGPGTFRGMSGRVVGNASRLMLLRIEADSAPPVHPAPLATAIVLEGRLSVSGTTGEQVTLDPGDSVAVESERRGNWLLANGGDGVCLVALVQHPPAK